MKLVSLAVLLYSAAAHAVQVPVTEEHAPNIHTLTCLKAPTRDCAFKAALQTVIDEEFGIERAKVLIGVARSMVAIGELAQAQQTLMLALDEARSVKISLVTQGKIVEIAPLLAIAGDTAGALALSQEISQDSVRDQLLLNIAGGLVQAGKIGEAEVAFAQVKNSSQAFWRMLALLPTAPRASLAIIQLEDLEAQVAALTMPEQKYRALIRLAVIADRMGRPGDRAALLAEADELFPSVLGLQARADVTGERARLMQEAGMAPPLVSASYELALLHGNKVQGRVSQTDLARRIAPIEAASGDIIKALKWLTYFESVEDKANFITSLPAGENASVLANAVRGLLVDVDAVDGAYDRDLIRLTLLEGALKNKDILLASQIIEALEDDDNQALGLVLMAPLLS